MKKALIILVSTLVVGTQAMAEGGYWYTCWEGDQQRWCPQDAVACVCPQ